MPDGNPLASLYPQPPQNQPNALLNNPGQLLGLVAQGRALQGQQAMQNAIQGAIGSDGSYNPNAAMTALKNNPNAWLAPGDVNSILESRARNISNSTAELDLGVKSGGAAATVIASFAGRDLSDPSVMAELRTKLAAVGVPPVIAEAYRPKAGQIAGAVKSSAAQVMGPGAAASPISGAPDASGAPTQKPLIENIGTPSTPTGLPPGEEKLRGASYEAYVSDQLNSQKVAESTRPLLAALLLVEKLSASDFGPGSKEFGQLKGILTTAGLIGPNATNLDMRQAASKYLIQSAKAIPGADRSDSALSTALQSNPTMDLTQPAALKLIKGQIAMSRQTQLMPEAFRQQNRDYDSNPKTMQKYLEHREKYTPSTDLNALQFDLMSPKEQADLRASLGPKDGPAYQKFLQTYNMAKRAGVLQPPPQGQ